MTGCRLRETVEQKNLLSFHQWRRRAAVAHTWAGGICPQKKKKRTIYGLGFSVRSVAGSEKIKKPGFLFPQERNVPKEQ